MLLMMIWRQCCFWRQLPRVAGKVGRRVAESGATCSLCRCHRYHRVAALWSPRAPVADAPYLRSCPTRRWRPRLRPPSSAGRRCGDSGSATAGRRTSRRRPCSATETSTQYATLGSVDIHMYMYVHILVHVTIRTVCEKIKLFCEVIYTFCFHSELE